MSLSGYLLDVIVVSLIFDRFAHLLQRPAGRCDKPLAAALAGPTAP
jgi:hypothetical protein